MAEGTVPTAGMSAGVMGPPTMTNAMAQIKTMKRTDPIVAVATMTENPMDPSTTMTDSMDPDTADTVMEATDPIADAMEDITGRESGQTPSADPPATMTVRAATSMQRTRQTSWTANAATGWNADRIARKTTHGMRQTAIQWHRHALQGKAGQAWKTWEDTEGAAGRCPRRKTGSSRPRRTT